MPWCPKCKNEYYEGIKVCADCGCELVDSLEELENAEKEEELRQKMEIIEQLAAEDLEEAFENDEDSEEEAGKRPVVKWERDVYKSNAEKAADNRSSAYTLLGVGLIGLCIDVLCFCDVIHLPLGESFKFMILGVMGAMFLLFLVMGAVSLKNAGKYAKKAESEKELTEEVEKWFVEHVTAEKVDEGLFSEEEEDFSEEQKYFKRYEKIKGLISERFLNLEEGYTNHFIDEHYQDIFS